MSRGHVEETKATVDKLVEIGAFAKGGDDCRLREGFGGVRDPEGRAKHQNEVVDDDCLGLQARRSSSWHVSRGGG